MYNMYNVDVLKHQKKKNSRYKMWIQTDRLQAVIFIQTMLISNECFNICTQVLSAENLCKPFGPKAGRTFCRTCSGSKLSETVIVFLNSILKKLFLRKKGA